MFAQFAHTLAHPGHVVFARVGETKFISCVVCTVFLIHTLNHRINFEEMTQSSTLKEYTEEQVAEVRLLHIFQDIVTSDISLLEPQMSSLRCSQVKLSRNRNQLIYMYV